MLSGRSGLYEKCDSGEVLAHRRYVTEHLFREGPIDTVQERLETWERTSAYKKGIVGQDGWVEPFTLGCPPTVTMDGSLPEFDASLC